VIREVAAYGLVLLAAAGLTGCREDAVASAGVTQPITIVCDPGAACAAKPDYLDAWPKKMEVISRETWKCSIVSGGDARPCSASVEVPAGTQAWLELRGDGGPDHVVRLAVIDAHRDPSGVLPLVGLTAAVLALLMAAGVAYFAWNMQKASGNDSAALHHTIHDLERTVQSVSDLLVFPNPPEPAPNAEVAAARMPREVEAIQSEIARFVKFVKDCFVALGKIPDEVENQIRELERVLSHLEGHADSQAARARYRSLAKTLSRLALQAADDDFRKHRKRNTAAEAALDSLLDAAGYRLLEPKPNEKYTDGRHSAGSRTEPAMARNQHGLIARVERRGLVDSNNEVIEKAEVVLYDYRSY